MVSSFVATSLILAFRSRFVPSIWYTNAPRMHLLSVCQFHHVSLALYSELYVFSILIEYFLVHDLQAYCTVRILILL